MGWIRKMKIGVLLSLAALSFSQPALAERNDQTLTEIYTAPDGNVIEREFYKLAVGEFVGLRIPYKTIVLCSNDSEQYLAPLQAFVDYVLADMEFIILDGRQIHENLNKNETTFVYFGDPDPVDQTAPGSCLSKYPDLKSFVEDKRDNEPRFVNIFGIKVSGEELGNKYPIRFMSFNDQQEAPNINLKAGFCFNEGRSCSSSAFTNLFSFKSLFCMKKDECGKLFDRENWVNYGDSYRINPIIFLTDTLPNT